MLTRYGRDTSAVFDLLGRGEVDLTAALGWTLSRSPLLLRALWARLGLPSDPGDVELALEVADAEGRTDLELVAAAVTVIIEAKKGWLLPGEAQLTKYLPRLSPERPGLLVSLSDSSSAWAARVLPDRLEGVPVRHLPWDDVRADLRTALRDARGAERQWLTELSTYLAGATAVRDPAEQWVYCVVINDKSPGGGGPHTFREVVQKHRLYYHPFAAGGGWPKRPPILMAFRWGGLLRQVNRISGDHVVETLQEEWPTIPVTATTVIPHIVYHLDRDIPIPEIPTTGVYRARRVWVLLDQLLTAPTLLDAEQWSRELTTAVE
jgi:hypothetical protein